MPSRKRVRGWSYWDAGVRRATYIWLTHGWGLLLLDGPCRQPLQGQPGVMRALWNFRSEVFGVHRPDRSGTEMSSLECKFAPLELKLAPLELNFASLERKTGDSPPGNADLRTPPRHLH